MSWEQAIEELEAADGRLSAVDPQDLGRVAEALEARTRALGRITTLVAAQSAPSEEQTRSMQASLKAGGAVEQKLLLTRAAAGAELAAQGRAEMLVRAYTG